VCGPHNFRSWNDLGVSLDLSLENQLPARGLSPLSSRNLVESCIGLILGGNYSLALCSCVMRNLVQKSHLCRVCFPS
jgi:hypothetical protein